MGPTGSSGPLAAGGSGRSGEKGLGAGRREVEGRSAGGVRLSAGRGRRARGAERTEGERVYAGPRERVLGPEGKGEREVERAVALGWAGLGAGFSFLFSIPFPLFYSICKQLKSI